MAGTFGREQNNYLYIVGENPRLLIKSYGSGNIIDKSIKIEPVGCNNILEGDHYHNQELSFIPDDCPQSALDSAPSSLRPADQNCISVIFPSYYFCVGVRRHARILSTLGRTIISVFNNKEKLTLYRTKREIGNFQFGNNRRVIRGMLQREILFSDWKSN